ncbi:MAG TPA: hypothetical protein VM073_02055 [Usitatibacter sp.]|nr:hypothetical protein [Usitatibacter sp.]
MKTALRRAPLALWLALALTPAAAQLSISFNVPSAQIGINLYDYPRLERVPGYPVYYAPGMNSNYFFYDGLYWIYERDNWYASSWYNGPWGLVDPFYVPAYVLRVPVRYYRHAPVYFRSWRADAPPRWGEHWGRGWEQRRTGWDRWDRRSSPNPAPLPTYQRQYRADRYPDASRQAIVHSQNYRYQPREEIGRQHYEERRQQSRTAEQERAQRFEPRQRDQVRQEPRRQEQVRPEQARQERVERQDSRARQQRELNKENGQGQNINRDHSGG